MAKEQTLQEASADLSNYIAMMTEEHHAAKIQKAVDDGFKLVFDDDYTLLLDLDNFDQIATYKANFFILQKYLEIVEHDKWVSKSGNGQHVVLKLGAPMDREQRHLLQAALGSDPRRELLGWIGRRVDTKYTNVLFKPPLGPPPVVDDDTFPF